MAGCSPFLKACKESGNHTQIGGHHVCVKEGNSISQRYGCPGCFSLVLIITVPSVWRFLSYFTLFLIRTVVMLIYDLLVPCLLFLATEGGIWLRLTKRDPCLLGYPIFLGMAMHSGEGVDRIKPTRLLPRTLMLQLVGKTIKFLRDKCRTNNSLEFISRVTWKTHVE